MPRLSRNSNSIQSKIQKCYPPAEVLYSVADALYNAALEGNFSLLLQERLEQDIKEASVRYLLDKEKVKIEISPQGDSAKISLRDDRISPELRLEKLETIVKILRDAA